MPSKDNELAFMQIEHYIWLPDKEIILVLRFHDNYKDMGGFEYTVF